MEFVSRTPAGSPAETRSKKFAPICLRNSFRRQTLGPPRDWSGWAVAPSMADDVE
ncbi:unnamed protein product, partial [Nesidiocoris tenuis]